MKREIPFELTINNGLAVVPENPYSICLCCGFNAQPAQNLKSLQANDSRRAGKGNYIYGLTLKHEEAVVISEKVEHFRIRDKDCGYDFLLTWVDQAQEMRLFGEPASSVKQEMAKAGLIQNVGVAL